MQVNIYKVSERFVQKMQVNILKMLNLEQGHNFAVLR